MLEDISQWLTEHEALIGQIGNASLLMLVVTIVAMPIIVMKLPEDYFVSDERKPASKSRQHPFFWWIASLLKNIVGLVLIAAGIVMLVLPGQGTVTVLIGLAISNFPGKYKLERRIASQPAVGKTLNKIREWTNTPPLQMPDVPAVSDH